MCHINLFCLFRSIKGETLRILDSNFRIKFQEKRVLIPYIYYSYYVSFITTATVAATPMYKYQTLYPACETLC